MKSISLDLTKMTSLPTLHRYLHQALALPEYYGCNLDALYDCLTEISEPTQLTVPAAVQREEYLGWYGQQLITVLQEAAAANASLQVIVA